MDLKECFDLLNIPEGSDVDRIKEAYRKKAREIHPDANQDTKEQAEHDFKDLNSAYLKVLEHAKQPKVSKSSSRSSHVSRNHFDVHDNYRIFETIPQYHRLDQFIEHLFNVIYQNGSQSIDFNSQQSRYRSRMRDDWSNQSNQSLGHTHDRHTICLKCRK